MNLYDILGVKSTCSLSEIKRAYKEKAGQCHPDKNSDDPEATIKFQTLTNAYNVLKDPEQRRRYDETGETGNTPSLNEEANSVIGRILLDIAEREDFVARNYFVDVRMMLKKTLAQCKSDKLRMETSSNKLEYLISKTKANNMLISMLNQKLHELNHGKAHAEQGCKVMSKALELLTEYRYTGQAPVSTSTPTPWVGIINLDHTGA